ncbi:helix-turn-helix transcriptional regulator [Chitinibacter tainanensis]|uniref:AraC family transcriptional regulator n=1 Tax=Chitinibacter tainanensis TaxID=230667 RepID=UPI002356FBA8|nr:helix-turn-helix transcriptional regulator [Chitinibacter tainanensis]
MRTLLSIQYAGQSSNDHLNVYNEKPPSRYGKTAKMDCPYTPLDLTLPTPAPLYLRHEAVEAHTGYALHRHPWGQLNRINLGLLEITLDQETLVAPADFLVWVPAEVPHAAYISQALAYSSAYVSPEWAARLPAKPCLLSQTPLVRALFDDFYQRQVQALSSPLDQQQAELLLGRLCLTPKQGCYLPHSEHRQLAPILRALQAQPGDNQPLSAWAAQVHTSERTLARLFQRELGMNFGQWRQRLRLLTAQSLLKQGVSIADMAWQLGYGNPSAFIAMFRQHTGLSPERYRQQSLDT